MATEWRVSFSYRAKPARQIYSDEAAAKRRVKELTERGALDVELETRSVTDWEAI